MIDEDTNPQLPKISTERTTFLVLMFANEILINGNSFLLLPYQKKLCVIAINVRSFIFDVNAIPIYCNPKYHKFLILILKYNGSKSSIDQDLYGQILTFSPSRNLGYYVNLHNSQKIKHNLPFHK